MNNISPSKLWTVDKLEKEIAPLLNSGVDALEAVIHVIEKHNIDIEVIASVVKRSSYIKEKMKTDSEKLNLLKK